jgi:AcrR family transcriptional regulator
MNKGPEGRRAGRRSGQPDTKAAILDAARAHFTTSGYRAATVRAIAADADVDAAMINYFFGSKQQLFGAALALPANPAVIIAGQLEGPIAELPRRLLTTLVETWDNTENRPTLLTLVQSATDGSGNTDITRGFIEEVLAGPLAERLRKEGVPPADASLRGGLLMTQLVGVIFARYVLRVAPVADLPAASLINGLVPALDAVLNPPPG